jgi:hypothetical protein
MPDGSRTIWSLLVNFTFVLEKLSRIDFKKLKKVKVDHFKNTSICLASLSLTNVIN